MQKLSSDIWNREERSFIHFAFLCYVNDMYTSVSADCKLILYANVRAILN